MFKRFKLAKSVLSLWEPVDTRHMNKYVRTLVNAGISITTVLLIEYVPVVAMVIVGRELYLIGEKGVGAYRLHRRWMFIKEQLKEVL